MKEEASCVSSRFYCEILRFCSRLLGGGFVRSHSTYRKQKEIYSQSGRLDLWNNLRICSHIPWAELNFLGKSLFAWQAEYDQEEEKSKIAKISPEKAVFDVMGNNKCIFTRLRSPSLVRPPPLSHSVSLTSLGSSQKRNPHSCFEWFA